MTISSTVCKVTHTIDPGNAVYTFPFKIFKKHEAAVWVLGQDEGESLRLRLESDYLVSGHGNDSGGTITLTDSGLSQAAKGQRLLVIRAMDFTQDVDYRPHDIFPAHSHERALDTLTMQNQQLLEMMNRAVLVPLGHLKDNPWGEFAGLTGRAFDAAEAAEKASLEALKSGHEASASASAASLAAAGAEKSLASFLGHNEDPNAHAALFAGAAAGSHLTGDTTFYVRPDGDDSNDGLADTAARALKTVGGAISLLGRTAQRGHLATISLASGQWPTVALYGYQLNGRVRLTSTDKTNIAFIAGLTIESFADVVIGDIGFNGGFSFINCYFMSRLWIDGPITFKGATGAGGSCMDCNYSHVQSDWRTNPPVTITFENVQCGYTVTASSCGQIGFDRAVLRGSTTGMRYRSQTLSMISTGNKGPNFIPGASAGVTNNGGLYL